MQPTDISITAGTTGDKAVAGVGRISPPLAQFRRLGLTGAVIALIGSLLSPGLAQATATTDVALPLATTYGELGHYQIAGSSDGQLYISHWYDRTVRGSSDGTNWSDAVRPSYDFERAELAGDRYVTFEDGGDQDTVAAYPLAGGAPLVKETSDDVLAVGQDGFLTEHFGDTSDGFVYTPFGSGSQVTLSPPAVTGNYSPSWAIRGTSAIRVIQGDEDDQGHTVLREFDVLPVSGAAGPSPATPNLGAVTWTIGDDAIWYVTVAGSTMSLCSVTFALGAPDCQDVLTGTLPDLGELDIHALGDHVALTYFSRSDMQYHVIGSGGAATIAFPAGTTFPNGGTTPSIQDDGVRLLAVAGSGGTPSVFAVAADGSTSVVATLPRIDAPPLQVAFGGNSIYAADRRPSREQHGLAVWRRSTTPDEVGDESLLPVRATNIAASAGRLAVTQSEKQIVTFYDRGAKGTSVAGVADSGIYVPYARNSALSGPYVLIQPDPDEHARVVYRADGKKIAGLSNDAGLFGSRVVEVVSGRIRVRDLASPGASSILGPTVGDSVYDLQMSGDWISWTGLVDAADEYHTFAYSLKTHVQRERSARDNEFALGDGVLAVKDRAGNILAWDLTTGAVPVTLGHGELMAANSNQVAWVDDQDALHLTTLGFGGTSAPRLLGTVAPGSFATNSTWRPQFDATKPLAAGTLVIKSGSTLIRSIATEASADGSVRNPSWDGKDSGGRTAAPGTYDWTFHADATDGTGALTNLAGSADATGKVSLLGTLVTRAPAINGTAVFGHQLTAVPGSWSPTPVTLRYQWLRNGKAIASATKSTYVVSVKDIGTKLSVRVTGSKPLYETVARTSSPTKQVAAARFTATPTPTIGGSRQVGSTLTAKPGAWQPAKVILSYQWTRDGNAIKSATGSSYTLKSADRGRRISVSVTGRKVGYSTVTKTSAATSKIT